MHSPFVAYITNNYLLLFHVQLACYKNENVIMIMEDKAAEATAAKTAAKKKSKRVPKPRGLRLRETNSL